MDINGIEADEQHWEQTVVWLHDEDGVLFWRLLADAKRDAVQGALKPQPAEGEPFDEFRWNKDMNAALALAYERVLDMRKMISEEVTGKAEPDES